MNSDTGQVQRFEMEKFLADKQIPIERLPDPGCGLCHGWGWNGRDGAGQVIPCSCVTDGVRNKELLAKTQKEFDKLKKEQKDGNG